MIEHTLKLYLLWFLGLFSQPLPWLEWEGRPLFLRRQSPPLLAKQFTLLLLSLLPSDSLPFQHCNFPLPAYAAVGYAFRGTVQPKICFRSMCC